MDVVDPHLIGGVHLSRQRRAAFDAAGGRPHEASQVSTIHALMDGRYEGDLTLAELVDRGDLGLGTLQHLDGELVVVDGRCWRVGADGEVGEPDPATRTPFAVVCRFAPGRPVTVTGPLSFDALTARVDALAPPGEPVVALRIDGRFRDLTLRSVPRQHPPYPPLREVVAHQTTWVVPELHGSLVGFRFPAELQGVEVPGYHLHVLSDDRRVGGHVVDLTLETGLLLVDAGHELHLEVPAGVLDDDLLALDGSSAAGEAIAEVEGRPPPTAG